MQYHSAFFFRFGYITDIIPDLKMIVCHIGIISYLSRVGMLFLWATRCCAGGAKTGHFARAALEAGSEGEAGGHGMRALPVFLIVCCLAAPALAAEQSWKLHLACKKLYGDNVAEYSEIAVDLNQAYVATAIEGLSTLMVVKTDTIEFLIIDKRGSEKHVISRITGMKLISNCNKDFGDIELHSASLVPDDLDTWCAGEWKQIGAQECKRVETQRQF